MGIDYTKASRSSTIASQTNSSPLTLQALLEVGITEAQINSSTYTVHNSRQRVRLINQDNSIASVPALYPTYSKDIVIYLQQFSNVGPYCNHSCNNLKPQRGLDLYLSPLDVKSITPTTNDNPKLPKSSEAE